MPSEVTNGANGANGSSNGHAQRSTKNIKTDGDLTSAWKGSRPRLIVTADTDGFDDVILSHFEEEGYQIAYIPFTGDQRSYEQKIQQLADTLETGEQYAIVAYGEAASITLKACTTPMSKLCAAVAYYPITISQTTASFLSPSTVQIHLAGSQEFGTRHPCFRYPNTDPGFAESDLNPYDRISSNLAWSRTLGCLRAGFSLIPDLESIWDNHTRLEFEARDAAETMKTMVAQPYVNHVPTMTGGIGATDLHRFYRDHFIPSNPPDTAMKLLSRTVGTDRVVDEFIFSFTHTTPVPWMLPGIPPTGKKVEVAMVAVVCIHGTRLYHEHIHWDQATVLVQVGLLDPFLVPKGFATMEAGREKEVKRLPVLGSEAARKVADKNDGVSNELIPEW